MKQNFRSPKMQKEKKISGKKERKNKGWNFISGTKTPKPDGLNILLFASPSK